MYKRYLAIITAIFVIGLLGHVAIVIHYDPYRVFGLNDYNRVNFEPNTRFLKVEQIKQHPEYEAFILGSSRAGIYSTATISQLSGLNYYNYGVSAASIEGVIRRIYWLTGNRDVKQIFLALDYDVMCLNHTIGEYDLLRQEHYELSGENPLRFYYKYLLFQPQKIRRVIRENEKPVWYEFDLASGQHSLPLQAAMLKADPEAYTRNGFDALGYSLDGVLPAERLHALVEAIQYLKAQDVELICVINPYHHLFMREYDLDDYALWLRTLVEQGVPVWDFSGFNTVTADNANYYDVLHFTEEVGDMVLQRVYGGSSGFGVLLTAENVEQRVEQIMTEKRSYELAHRNL